MCEPRMLANVLRYLLYARAHKERASLPLLRALGEIRLDEPPFDVTMYQGFEQLSPGTTPCSSRARPRRSRARRSSHTRARASSTSSSRRARACRRAI